MKLFVTGMAGRLGKAIALEAQAQQIELVGIDQIPWPDDVPMPDCLNFHQGSFHDEKLIDRLMPGCDGFINTAGMHGNNLKENDMADFVEANVTQVARLLTKAKEHGIKCVALSSTMEVLIGRTEDPNLRMIFDETSTPNCDTIYSGSKLLMEHLARIMAIHTGLSIASLRYMAFGYGSPTRGGPRLLSKLMNSGDVARAVILAAQTPNLQGEVIHIAASSPFTPSDLPLAHSNPAALVESYYPGAGKIFESQGMTIATADLLPFTSIAKAKRVLGWEPQWTFDAWLRSLGWEGSAAPSNGAKHAASGSPR